MAKVLVSFAVGVAVAALGLSLLDREPASAFLEQPAATTPSRQSVETSGPRTIGDSPAVMPNGLATDSESGEIEESVRSANARPPRPPPEQPIYLPPEFDWLANDPEKFHSHDLVQREPYNVNWAPAMEGHLSKFLSENPEITQTYGYPRSIVCRTSQCELLFVAYDLETRLDDEHIESSWNIHFTESISDFFERPEFEEFHWPNNIIFSNGHTEKGVTSFAWWLVSQDTNRPGGAFEITEERRKAAEERRRKPPDPAPAPNR